MLKAAYQKAIDNGTIVKNTPFCKLVQKAINKENDNAKTSSLYEESKTYSSKENGDEYQILISETDKYGFNNHAIYDPKKRIADKIRIS